MSNKTIIFVDVFTANEGFICRVFSSLLTASDFIDKLKANKDNLGKQITITEYIVDSDTAGHVLYDGKLE